MTYRGDVRNLEDQQAAMNQAVDRFGSLEAIDQPGVRIIVNPGGTNQKFVKANISRAEVIVFNDNRAIFDEIIAERADLMITDAVEVALQSRKHAALCPTMPDRLLSRQEKAFLLPRDPIWRDIVNRWLSGVLQRVPYPDRLAEYAGRMSELPP